jgi:hypothetical protein
LPSKLVTGGKALLPSELAVAALHVRLWRDDPWVIQSDVESVITRKCIENSDLFGKSDR